MPKTGRFWVLDLMVRLLLFALAAVCLGCATGSSAEEEKQDEGFLYKLQPLIVNLLDKQGHQILKLGLALELESEAAKKDIEDQLPRVLNNLILTLSGREFEKIRSADGKQQLRKDILDTLDRTLGPGKVKSVYFAEFLTTTV